MTSSGAVERGRAGIRLPRQPTEKLLAPPAGTLEGDDAAKRSDSPGSVGLRRRVACLIGAGYFLMMAGWALCTPLPAMDERAQVVKAVATVRGQLLGTVVHVDRADLGLPVNSDFGPGLASRYVVPGSYAGIPIPCFPAKPVYPRCMAPMSDSAKPTKALSYVGNYNPIYYALVGWPSLFVLGAKSVYLMRLCTCVINALLLAWTAHTLLLARGPRRKLICFLAATTPMTLFLGGIVNPAGVEITSAELLWSVLLLLATDEQRPVGQRVRELGPRAAAGLFLLLNLRMMGPLWAAGAVATSFWVASPERRRLLLHDRRIRGSAPLFSIVGAAALLWTKFTPVELSSLRDIHPHFSGAARVSFDETPGYFKMMLFSYNWGDPQIPAFAIVVLGAVLAVLLVPVLGDSRFGRPLLAILAVTVLFPIVLQGVEMHRVGDVWQGRYILPLAVGALFLAGFAEPGGTGLEKVEELHALDDFDGCDDLRASTGRWLLMLTAAGELTCLWWAVRHNANVRALDGPLLPRHAHWSPPVTWPGALLPFVVGLALVLRQPFRRLIPATPRRIRTPAAGSASFRDQPSNASEG